jgi:alpha-D-xyloside xylohydrolase
MKFTDGLWQLRPGVTELYAAEAYDICAQADAFTVTAPTAVIHRRGDTLNRPVLSLRL